MYNRGYNRESIFTTDNNYVFLLRRAKSFLADYPLTMIAFCLMPNHCHFMTSQNPVPTTPSKQGLS